MSTATEIESAMRWLDCLIERELLRLRGRYELSLDELRGLYISDRQVDALVRERLAGEKTLDPIEELTQRARTLAPRYEEGSMLSTVAARLGLDSTDLDILLLALAPEIDLRYETLFAYLNNDVSRKHLTVDLALRLLTGARETESKIRSRFAGSEQLCSSGALSVIDSADKRSSLNRGFACAPLLAQFLTRLPLSDPHWHRKIHWLPALDATGIAPSTREALLNAGDVPLTFILGEESIERVRCAGLWSHLHAQPLLYVPLFALPAEGAPLRSLELAARLAHAAIVLDDDSTHDCADKAGILRSGLCVLLLTQRAERFTAHVLDLPFARVQVDLPQPAQRAQLWKQAANISDEQAQSLAMRFAIGPARIHAAVQSVVTREAPTPERLAQQLAHQASRRANDSLARLATRLDRPHTWQQLVLPDSTLRQLREVTGAIAQRDRVYRDWGMLDRTARSSGVMMLFSGASGTGKTMAASVVANDAGLELYRIDLASVVSKYIGETEQNLDRIFNAARGGGAMLFFDEADALLGKRSEVKDAHDRYANLEVAYLLQKMEEHDGIVVLASNLPKNLDSAFARRMHYTIEFAKPNAHLREALWRGMFPSSAPLAADIDFAFLATKFETTGGEIQAIALDAAFLAAASDTEIGMAHLMRAVTRRQTKQGNSGGMARFQAHRALLDAAEIATQ